MKKLHIKTYGCQMNVYDSGRIAEILTPLGFALTDRVEDADMVILNTCHIREKAAEKVYSELGRLRTHKTRKEKAGGRMILGVAGCVAQAQGQEVLKRAPFVDLVFGPQTYHRLGEMVARTIRGHGAVLNTDFPEDNKFDSLPLARTVNGSTAFLAVQEGCDKFCTYCVVPYTRGAEYSRRAADILAEARQLVSLGAKEITFLGQNVNAYHGESPSGKTWGLGRLIRETANLEGLERIRYTTSYPADMNDALISAHADVETLMPYLHLPVQAGSDTVLKAMNRPHTIDDYKRVVDKLRTARSDLTLSSDFIVGFPGETEVDFEATLNLIEDVTFIQAYSFKYSARPGIPAAILDNQISEGLKAERLARLQALLNAQTLAFNKTSVGQHQRVLFERSGKHPGQLIGRSPHMQSVVVEADAGLMNAIHEVAIIAAGPNSLTGTLDFEKETGKKRACA